MRPERIPDSPASRVVTRLRASGHRALLAGGAVRDLLLGREPADFDVATSATPSEVRALFDKVVPVGEPFGVVIVVTGQGPVEVATFRHDAVYEDGRRPVGVRFTDRAEEDARRRDFTVNGLFLDPDTGRILDYVGGRSDLEAGVIRAIGDPAERFAEDRLRMLRAVRFACSLGFEIEAGTLDALRRLAPGIGAVSGERIRDELVRILTGPAPRRGLELMLDSGLLAVVLPEVAAMAGIAQPPEFHPEGDVFVHTCLVLEELDAPSPALALAALLHDVGKPPTFRVEERIRFDRHAPVGAEMAGAICRRLRLSRAETEQVVELVRDHLKFMHVRKMREAKLRRFLLSPLAGDHLALHRADCLASHRDLGNYEFCRKLRDAWLEEAPPPPRLVTGRDLIGMGLTPGPVFAKILGEVEDLTLEGALSSKEDALRTVRSWLERGGFGEE